MVRENPFDTVLLDLLMPEIDEFDVLKIIKRMREFGIYPSS
jgi:CheY-like chemotaxis protein